MGEPSTVTGLLQLLLHLHILVFFSKLSTAVVAGDYAASFTPHGTHDFWLSKPDENFTFGFKLVDDGEYLLAIWHSLDADQIPIWWADFGDANNSVKKGATFNYTSSRGVLQLSDSSSALVWQSGNSTSTSTSLQFLDTGNLKLLKDDDTALVWESFEDCRDSLMLTGLNASRFINKPLVLQSRRNQTSFAKGRFHMATYNNFDIHLFGLDGLNKQYVYMKDYNVSLRISGDVVSVGNQLDGSAFVTSNASLWRLSLDYDANLRVYQWLSNRTTWVNVWELLPDATLMCRAQSPCGPFGLCQRGSENTTTCSCPTGYAPISPDDPTKGCNSSRIVPVCGPGKYGNDTVMEEVQLGDYYYNDLTWLTDIYDIEGCKNACLNNCACIAATYNSGSWMCFLKGNTTMGYLENGILSGAGSTTLLMKLLKVQDVGAGLPLSDKKGRHSVSVTAVVVPLATTILAAFIFMICWWRRRRYWWSCYGGKQDNHGREQDNESWFDAGPRRFSYEELEEATKNFSDWLGEGGFGEVFRGQVRERQDELSTTSELGMKIVAVKVLKQLGYSGKKEENLAAKQFRVEVGMLSKIHHVNLVSLLGYCIGGPGGEKRRMLVYEYMDKGSLDRYLSPVHMSEPLPWSVRYSIVLGTARGIIYLHHDCHPPILHCDIKPQNVLLDEHFTPKVADFGLASYIGKMDQSHLTVSGVRGTPGYMAPDWLKNDGVTSKADVYSFGVLLLGLVHGLKSTQNVSLIDWALQCLAAGSLVSDSEIASADNAGNQGSHDATMALEVDTSGSTWLSTQIIVTEKGESDLEAQLRCLRVALWCVHDVPTHRPSMLQVLQQLEGTRDIQDPPDPIATNDRNPSRVCFDSDITSPSKNTFSFSIVSGR